MENRNEFNVITLNILFNSDENAAVEALRNLNYASLAFISRQAKNLGYSGLANMADYIMESKYSQR